MTFLVADLLLTPDKQADLDAALSATGIADPLGLCIEEAIAEVSRMISGYRIDDTSQKTWIRALALHQAYTLIGSIPQEIKDNADMVRAELRDIAAGKRVNLTKIDEDDADVDPGDWGSEDKIS